MNRKRTRANGEGSLIKRGNVFFAKWWYDGKVYVKTTKCTNRRDAEKRLAEASRLCHAKKRAAMKAANAGSKR